MKLHEPFSMLCGSLDYRGVWGMDSVYAWLSPLCYSPETTAKLLNRLGGKNTQKNYTKKILMTQITTVV